MATALYYPHTQIQNESLIKTALLLWDRIDYIVPNHTYSAESRLSPDYQRAIELIGRARTPSEIEKQEAHKNINAFLRRDLPESLLKSKYSQRVGSRAFSSSAHDEQNTYLIYKEKFADKTWELLQDYSYAEWVQEARDYGVPPAIGLVMMSLLADACAGMQMVKVTDREDAYAWLSENLTQRLGGEYTFEPTPSNAEYDQLVTLSIKILDVEQISLEKLLAMREREERSSGSSYRDFRKKYLEELTRYVNKLRSEVKTPNDITEIEEEFKNNMNHDLAQLKSDLSEAKDLSLLSKEVGVSVLASFELLANPIQGLLALGTAGLLGIGALIKKGMEYQSERKRIMEKHPMSWLYLNRK